MSDEPQVPDQQAQRDQWLASVADTAAQAKDVAEALHREGFNDEQIGMIVGQWWGHSIQASHVQQSGQRMVELLERLLGGGE